MALSRSSTHRPSLVAQFETSEQTAHKLGEFLFERFAADGVAVDYSDAGGGRWRVAVHFHAAKEAAAIRAAVAAAAGAKSAKALRVVRVAGTDWVHAGLAGLAPVVVGRFAVHGAHDRARIPLNRIGIEIEAGLAFGTGHHGTTRGCLVALERICKSVSRRRSVRRILDLGTGSGVLAIAAARALRTRVLATDIDADAVRLARDNAALNHAAVMIEVMQADGVAAGSIGAHGPFDLIFANILLRPLQRMAAQLKRRVAPGGRLVLSGLLSEQASAAIAAYRPLALERRIVIDGWATLVFVRRLS
jgi:ribosomal protein L11 methyltransferase